MAINHRGFETQILAFKNTWQMDGLKHMDKLEAYERLLADTFQLQLNAGDFFYYACAQMLNVVSEDVEWVTEHIRQFGDDGLYSAMAYIQNQEPIKPYLTEKFNEALKVLIDRKQEVFGDIDWDYHGYKDDGNYRIINKD